MPSITNTTNKYEKQFYQALEDLFVGAKIEGMGGYVNLLQIKSAYYRVILAKFKEQVEQNAILRNSAAREEFFDRLYSFFKNYFSENGSVYFCKTAYGDKKYERVYTDDKDVILFWKTNMLYYVKSDILFKNIVVSVKGEDEVEHKFAFDCSTLLGKQNNEKKELIFTYDKHGITSFSAEPAHILKVSYASGNQKTKLDDIAKKSKLSADIIEKAIRVFKKQNSVDFFINKDAKGFLSEQLDLYLHQILLDDKNAFTPEKLQQIKTVKEFAIKIIDFISQFENELVRVWNKPKFVLNSNYVISLDKLSKDIIGKIAKSKGLSAQIEEWQKLSIVDDEFSFAHRDPIKHAHLPIDTKYFKELESEILEQFGDLDETLDGRLIHSENYQALNTLKDRYKEQVQCIYIDPPFNTGEDFVFIDNYQDSTWLNIMDDRLSLCRSFMNKNANIYVQLDHIAEHYGKILLDRHFGVENYRAKISWNTGDNISGFKSKAKNWIRQSDYIHYYTKTNTETKQNSKKSTEDYYFIKAFEILKGKQKSKEEDDFGWLDILGTDKDNLYIEKWQENILKQIPVKLKVKAKGTIWNDIYSFQLSEPRITESIAFASNQKPENLLRRIIQTSSPQKSLVLDFFAGSGTTCAVSHKLNRKYLGVEMGAYFSEIYFDVAEINKKGNGDEDNESEYDDKANRFDESSVVEVIRETNKKREVLIKKIGLLGRMKIVVNGDKSFKSPSSTVIRHPHLSKDINWDGGGFFKYYDLEQYEQTLNRMQYTCVENPALFNSKNPFENYMFLTDTKLADVFDVKESDNAAEYVASLDFDKLYSNIDFAETISLLKGLPIKQIKNKTVTLADGKSYSYDFSKMNSEEKVSFAQMLKPLLWWGEE